MGSYEFVHHGPLTQAWDKTRQIRIVMDYDQGKITFQRPVRDGGKRECDMSAYDDFDGDMEAFMQHIYADQ